MPTKDSPKAQIEKLTEGLELATKVANNRGDQIESLEKTVKEKNLIIEDRCRTIGELIRTLEEERVKVSRVKSSFDALAIVYERTGQECDRLKTQNGALRAALKAVL